MPAMRTFSRAKIIHGMFSRIRASEGAEVIRGSNGVDTGCDGGGTSQWGMKKEALTRVQGTGKTSRQVLTADRAV